MSHEFYWNVIYATTELEFEVGSRELAEQAAQEWWAEECRDNHALVNGHSIKDDAWAVVHDKHGNKIGAHKFELYYEHYHGDFAEHNTMHAGAGGSL